MRKILNTDVEQRGSRVAPDSVRFDFSFGRAMTDEEKTAVENLVNQWIDADMNVAHEEMPIEDAKNAVQWHCLVKSMATRFAL